MSLNELKLGEKAVIKNLSNLNRYVKRRLLDLGILEGEEIMLKNRMPFHGPFMLEHNGQILGIRYKEATLIEIEQS
ncbi:FeoA family protein [Rummeliibacillus pycnus]|uniref:FeoA family protein n=1 Tax=Rummeliibacillus pycnus TaxID=101070 RepID=UPI000C9A4892|nr:FeoA family protein [Rummeliibacillus pycnus]